MYSCHVLPDNAQGEELGARKQRDNRRQERKPRHRVAVGKVPQQYPAQHPQSKQGETKTDEACQLQRKRGEAGHHIHRVSNQLAKCVARISLLPSLVTYRSGGEATRAPGQKHVDGDERALIVCKRTCHLRSDSTKGGNLASNFRSHDSLQSHLRNQGSQITQQTVFLMLRRAIDNVDALIENGE